MSRSLWRLETVKDKTGLTTSQIYEQQKRGEFPASVPLGPRTIGWVSTEVEAWIASRIAARDVTPRFRGGPGRGHRGPMAPLKSPMAQESKET
jgi:prophage regulatory protein